MKNIAQITVSIVRKIRNLFVYLDNPMVLFIDKPKKHQKLWKIICKKRKLIGTKKYNSKDPLNPSVNFEKAIKHIAHVFGLNGCTKRPSLNLSIFS